MREAIMLIIAGKIVERPEKWPPALVEKAEYFISFMTKREHHEYWSRPSNIHRIADDCIPWQEVKCHLPENWRTILEETSNEEND
jgi:hypothetical protein